jgi:hypothetical protein
MNRPGFVDIVQAPAGEAPDWVRQAWVGLRLPLARGRASTWRGVGVTTGAKTLADRLWDIVRGRTIEVRGYAVDARAAVDILAGSNPAAADWWRANAPQLLDGRRLFAFDAAACREVPP